MMFYGMRLLLIVAGLFHIALAVTYTCDPFYNLIQERQQTCLSSNIGHNASSDYLTIYSSFSGCTNNNGTESISTFFSDRFNPWTVQIDPGYEFYFEYTIMWTSTDSNCVVDLTPTSPSTNSSNPAVPWPMVDQNGISNNPLENLTDLALNKPYTRRFILSPGSPASYRFGFACARQNGENSTNAEQTAVVSGIMYGMTAEWAHWNTPVYYPPWGGFGCTTNTSCPDPAPHEDAICAIDSMWFYNGSYYAGALKSSPGVSGDLYLDEVLFGDSYIQGCFYPWHQSTITLVLYPDWMIRLRFGQQCNLPPVTIIGRPRTSEMQQLPGLSPNCNYTLNVEKVQIDFESTNYINYYAPLSAWDISCPNTNSPSSNTDGNDNGTYSDNGTLWALVFGIVGGVILIAVIIGIIFGVRKYKQRPEKKDEKKVTAEVETEKPSERR